MRGLSVETLRKGGRYVLDGKTNVGRCLTCGHLTIFVETGPWLANDYLCVRCRSMPRWRAIIHVLNTHFPNWRELQMHECGAGGGATRRFRQECSEGYSGSRYLVPEVARGEIVGNFSCQDIEELTFPDESFDLFITQDVLEHVLRPDRAMSEIARVLRPGGAHVYTVPLVHGRQTLVRVVPSETGGIEYLMPADYHVGLGGRDRSLVIREWGDDFVDFVSGHGGLSTEIVELNDRKLGLAGSPGHPLEVFISRK
jgi:SAM-dependent methyltransferase